MMMLMLSTSVVFDIVFSSSSFQLTQEAWKEWVLCVVSLQAEVLPQGKFDLVSRLQQDGRCVAMIG